MQASGRVDDRGLVSVSFRRDGPVAVASGQMEDNGGIGEWISPTLKCLGTWSAMRLDARQPVRLLRIVEPVLLRRNSSAKKDPAKADSYKASRPNFGGGHQVGWQKISTTRQPQSYVSDRIDLIGTSHRLVFQLTVKK